MDDQPTKSGIVVSGALHAALLAMILVGFAQAPKFDDAAEAVPVETITQSQFNEIMKGERNGKLAKEPVEKPAPKPVEAAAPGRRPLPPRPETPPVLKHIDDPGEDAVPTPPPKPTARRRPRRPRSRRRLSRRPPRRRKTRPRRRRRPPPDDAEIDRRQDTRRPQTVVTPPAPPTRPKVVEKPPEKPKEPTPDKQKTDSVAKFLEKAKADDEQKPPAKPKSGEATTEQPRQPFDPNAIAKLIGQAKPSPSRQMASADAARLADAERAAHVALAVRRARRLAAGGLSQLLVAAADHAAGREIRRADARLLQPRRVAGGAPALVNPPSDPAWRAYAESAMRAVLKCNPLHVPPQYVPYFEQWRVKTVHFDPQDAQG